MENLRVGNQDMLRVRHEPWDLQPGDAPSRSICRVGLLSPKRLLEGRPMAAGITSDEELRRCDSHRDHSYFDVQRPDMSIVGFRSRSALANGAPVELPDFRDESVRVK